MSPERIQAWEEENEDFPTLRQLRLLARAYKRPTAFFYRSEVPTEPPEDLPDYRLLPQGDLFQWDSPALRYEIRRARARRETAIEVLQLMGEEPPKLDLAASREEGAAVIGSRIREVLGVSLEEQFSWTGSYASLRGWIEAAEAVGIFVFQLSNVAIEEVRAFSLSERPLPVVALNGKDSPHGRIFSLLHEVAHIALNEGGLCDLHDSGEVGWLEPFCNSVAAAALLPEDALTEQADLQQAPAWPEEELVRLSRRFGVSREVVLRRFLTLNLTTRTYYQRKRAQYSEEYRRAAAESSGFLYYFRRVLRDNGPSFTSLLLDAYNQNAITARDLSHHLGDVKLVHIDKIRGALEGAVD